MSSDEKQVEASFVLEIIGKPKEHLVETLKELIKKIDSEKGVNVTSKQIFEPKEMKQRADFFTTYAEVEIKADEVLILASLMFKYMPSHIEILSPERFVLQNNGFADILNELTRRLHSYDEIARVMQAEKKLLQNKIKALEDSKK